MSYAVMEAGKEAGGPRTGQPNLKFMASSGFAYWNSSRIVSI